jgi:cold shock protein
MKGSIKFYNSSKGYGFIVAENGDDVFFHKTSLGKTMVRENDKVEFETEQGKKGVNAINIRRI